ncbi:MAG: adenylate/guanylate cyclase domain-containing protein [Rhizomicrobium sp.]|nr:adenylate/guanylate cyclase domain-containing protein [Rhizomicrobium sp.]
MIFRDRPFAVWGSPLVTLLLALIVLGTDAGGLATRLRGLQFDAYSRADPRFYEDTARTGHPVRLLEIDPASVARFGAWPWPHAALASVVEGLTRHGASVVVLVGRIERPDPLAGRNLAGLIPAGPSFDAARHTVEQLPSPDTALATALAGTKAVTGFVFDATEAAHPPQLKADIALEGARSPLSRLPEGQNAAGSLPLIEAASAGVGALTLAIDADGRVRRMPLAWHYADKAVPSLDAEVLRLIAPADKAGKVVLRSDDGNSGFLGGLPGVMAVETAAGALATAPDGSVWLAFAGPNPHRLIAASAVLSEDLPTNALAHAVVYIGDPSERALTPNGARPVAEIHAEAAENLLLGSVLRRPTAAEQGELLCLLLVGIGCSLLIARTGVRVAALGVVAVSAAVAYGAWHIFVSQHVLFDALGLVVALALVWATGAVARGIEIWRMRSALKRAFTDVLPKRVINVIARQPEPMKLDGETRTVTYLACGVRGFAELASSFRGDPAAFTRLIQRVLDPLMTQALNHGGAIDRMTADGFTAFWNAPLDDPEHAVHACEAAMGMMEAIAQTNDVITHERRIDGVALDPVEIGVGLSSGPAIAGGFKVHGRTAYSVNGDCAALAARIQQLSAQYGPAVIVSEDTRKAAERGFAFLEVDYIAPEHHEDPVKLYAMLGNPVMRASPKFRALATFHDHIFQSLRDQQWQKARELIAQCRKLSGASQKLYDMHLARIAYFQENPPGPDWDGAFRQILQ